jgi:hypothetical protein
MFQEAYDFAHASAANFGNCPRLFDVFKLRAFRMASRFEGRETAPHTVPA